MLRRFEGESGKRLLLDAFISQKMVSGNRELAKLLCDQTTLQSIKLGSILIEQGGADNDVYFIISGSFDIIVNGRNVARRFANDHIGEMSAIEPTQRRSASVIATEDSVVAKISEEVLTEIASKNPEIYRWIAKELSKRLLQRNSLISTTRDKIQVFIISSAESLEVARTIQTAFAHDDFLTMVWTDGVFKVTNYTLQSLEDQVDKSDFAIAIAHADDITESRGKDWPTPRDNVIFELGLFMGRLGKSRAILMEPRAAGVKLPSDLAGITTIPYVFNNVKDAAASMGAAINILRNHIRDLGPHN